MDIPGSRHGNREHGDVEVVQCGTGIEALLHDGLGGLTVIPLDEGNLVDPLVVGLSDRVCEFGVDVHRDVRVLLEVRDETVHVAQAFDLTRRAIDDEVETGVVRIVWKFNLMALLLESRGDDLFRHVAP